LKEGAALAGVSQQRHITADATEEPKLDGFGAVAYVEDGACRLVSASSKARQAAARPGLEAKPSSPAHL
jgi:hypothetical protein